MCSDQVLQENYSDEKEYSVKRNCSANPLVSLKSRLKTHLDYWENVIVANAVVTSVIKEGYKIPFTYTPQKSYCKNNKSALPNSDFVTDSFKDLDTSLPLEKVVGVYWDTENDIFRFRIVLKDKPLTIRGMLSLISFIFDPLGLVAPHTLRGKRILQPLCQDEIGWDEVSPDDIIREWQLWRKTLHSLEHYKISRCYKPSGFGKVKQICLYHFSDVSQERYGQVSYLRMVINGDEIQYCFLMGKARVTPMKFVSIPRLELTAAVLSAKCGKFIKKELQLECAHETFWTDSKMVLG